MQAKTILNGATCKNHRAFNVNAGHRLSAKTVAMNPDFSLDATLHPVKTRKTSIGLSKCYLATHQTRQSLEMCGAKFRALQVYDPSRH